MYFLYNNHVEGATITALSENPDYDFTTAFNDTSLSKVGRTVDDSAQTIIFDLLTAVAVSKVMIQDHNFTSGVTLTLEANATNVWTAPSYTTSLTYNATYIYKDLTTDQTYRYWRLTVDDASNPDTYIEISKVFLGTHLSCYMDTGIALDNNSNSSTSKSTSGQLFGNRQLQYKAAKFMLSDINPTLRTQLKAFWAANDIVKPFWLLIWETDLTVEEPIYCALTKPFNWSKQGVNGNLWTLAIEIEQAF
jgi:hypothetical protein